MMQDMGAERAGTALNTLLQAVVGGRMTKASFATAQAAGLIDADAKYKMGAGGHYPAGEAASGTVTTSPRRTHFNGSSSISCLRWAICRTRIAGLFLTQLFSNRNAQRAANDFLVNDWRYLKDEAQTLKPTGIASMSSLMSEDPEAAQRAAAAQWNKLWTTFGVNIIPKLVPLIEKMAEAMSKLSGLMARHPLVTQMAGELAIALTGLLAFTSGLKILTATLKATGLMTAGGQISGGLAGISGAAGKAGAIGAIAVAAGGISYEATQMIPGLGRAAGNFKLWVDHLSNGQPYNPIKAGGSTTQQPVVVQIDGRTVATVMSRHQADMSAGYNAGSALFDPKQSLLPSAY